MTNSTTRIVQIPDELSSIAVLGAADAGLREVEHAFPEVDITVRGKSVKIVSRSAKIEEDAAKAEHAIRRMVDAAYDKPMDAYEVKRMIERDVLHNSEHNVRAASIGHGGGIFDSSFAYSESNEFSYASKDVLASDEETNRKVLNRKARMSKGVITFAGGMPVKPKTAGQTEYVHEIDSHVVTFAIGPAGTGKTYLAVAKAVRALEDGRVRRIVLTRPAVEAGENLGFLPGTLNDKVDPYLRPLYDALSDMLGSSQLKRYLDENVVEVAPLAYMRGRTLNDAFVILDEAQNATVQQLKMFLTRLGFNTTMVITGDSTQVDLAVPRSGLVSIEKILGDVKDIAFVHLQAQDVVRHALVGRIVEAYERYDALIESKKIERKKQAKAENTFLAQNISKESANEETSYERNNE